MVALMTDADLALAHTVGRSATWTGWARTAATAQLRLLRTVA